MMLRHFRRCYTQSLFMTSVLSFTACMLMIGVTRRDVVSSISSSIHKYARWSSDNCSLHSNLASLAASPDSPTSRIPKIVHIIYKSTTVPKPYADFLKKCQRLNPDHRFIFWSDESGMAFIKENYPGHHNMFLKQLRHALEFSDALRYFIVFHFGGIYLDMDVECRKPFTSALGAYRCVLDRENEIQTGILWNIPYYAMNSLMACQRRHPFFKQAIDRLEQSIKTNNDIIDRTGPGFLTALFKSYRRTSLGRSRPVFLAPSSFFSPQMDRPLLKHFRRLCELNEDKEGFRKAACEKFKKQGYFVGNISKLEKDSIAIHNFFHFGWGFTNYITQHLCEVIATAVHIYKS